MHVDGIQQLQAVDDYEIKLDHNPSLKDQTIIVNLKHRDLVSTKTP